MTTSRGRVLALVLLVVALGACTTTGPREPGISDPGEQRGEPPRDRQHGEASLPELPRAAAALVAQAEAASAAGRQDEAVALLERALRIAPQHPVLWQNLAVVHYRARDYRQAEQLALRSNTFASGYKPLLRQNWQLIAVARHLMKDAAGAEAAKARAEELRDSDSVR